MKKMERARKTFSKLFTAQILILLSVVIQSLAEAIYTDETLMIAAAVLIVGGVVSGIGQIMEIIALADGRKLSNNLNIAFIFVIVSLILSIATVFLPETITSGIVGTIMDRLSNVVDLAVAYFVIFSIAELAKENNNKPLHNEALKVSKWYIVVAVLSIVSNVLISVLTNAGLTIVIIFVVLLIATYVMYLVILHKAAKTL